MKGRKGGIDRGVLFSICLFLSIVHLLWTFTPYFRDFWVMKELVKTATLDWHDTDNMGKAKDRLVREMYNREIPDYIYEQDCGFSEEGEMKIVYCYWEVDIYYVPGTDMARTVTFEFTTEIDKHRSINQY